MKRRYDLVIFDMDGTLISYRISPVHDAPLLLLPNVPEKLAELAADQVTLAVATNQVNGSFRGRPYTNAVIGERLAALSALLPMIPSALFRVGKPGTAHWKPKPGMLISLLEETETHKRDALFVGDSESDREAAENAGVDFAWAWEYFDWLKGPADRSINWEHRGDDIWRVP